MKLSNWCGYVGGKYGKYQCGNPVRFIARHENTETADIFVCGKHLAATLSNTEGVYIVKSVS